jgi:N-acetylmuramoyl-L-alanine amidase
MRVLGLALVAATLFWSAPAQAAAEWRVGLQAGHWRSNELPDELRSLRGSTGAAAGGVREYQVNLDVAQRAAGYLRDAGVAVDVLPATVPQNYLADAFVSLHADGNASTRLSGFKAAGHWRDWSASTALVEALRADYGPASGLAWDGGRISSNMRGYYALSSRRFNHAISNYTPGVILEMGYLTNPRDRQLMTQQADRLARGVAEGVLRFLRSKPSSGWEAPPPLPELRGTVTSTTANLRSGPGTNFPVVRSVNRNRILMIAEIRGDWLKLFSYRRNGERWIHRDNVRVERISDEPPTDS